MPSSTHIRKAYQLTPTRAGGKSLTTTQGCFCSVVQIAISVTDSCRFLGVPSRPRPTHP